jgi:hypothetical protein
VVKLGNRNVRYMGWKRKVLHIRSATEVHWSGVKRTWAEKKRLHRVISVLPIIPNIQLLSLRDADINEAQQAIIFGLPTLRTLAVYSCRFHPSKNPIPYAHLIALKLINISMQTIRHFLTILATTVEDLVVDVFGAGVVSRVLQGGLIALPKLSTFTMQGPDSTATQLILDTFKGYKSITTLHILLCHSLPDMSFHHSVLPALRSLSCDRRLAVNLIPGRPVKTYVEVFSYWSEDPWRLLDLSISRAGIINLKLFAPKNFCFCSLLLSLATSLQHLEQLTLRLYSPTKLARSPDHLSPQALHNPPRAAAVLLPKLKWVTIRMDDNRSTPFPPERPLNECFDPLCPVLEEFECLYFTLSFLRFDLHWQPEPKRAWKVRRLPDGSWERRGPPPIPILTPARAMHAEP